MTEAVACALALSRRIVGYNDADDAARAMYLRIGVHLADVLVDDLDVYGSGVNLAARLAALAEPGAIVVSAEVRDGLADGHDCHLVDMGECFLKHYSGTIRVFRVTPASGADVLSFASLQSLDDRPAVAVVPFVELPDGDAFALGDAIADDVIAALSQSAGVRVISRLSTSVFRNARSSIAEIRSLLGVAYVVSGQYRTMSGRVTLRAELCDARDGTVLWTDTLSAAITDIFNGQDDVVRTIASQIGCEVLRTEVKRARCLPISNLDGYTLYVASAFMLHRLSTHDFARAKDMLDHLCQRYPRSAAPWAMLSKWHGLRLAQGWAPSGVLAGREAQECARRALCLEPDQALALSMAGLMTAQLDGDLKDARRSCEAAVESNPQEPTAWMNLGGIHSYLGNAAMAESASLRAVDLSPMDPARFLFDVFVAAGKLAAGGGRQLS